MFFTEFIPVTLCKIYISSGPECDVSYSGWEQMKAWVSLHLRSLNFPFAEDTKKGIKKASFTEEKGAIFLFETSEK